LGYWQPWHFVVVKDQAMKHHIRVAAEKEEQEFYSGRAPLDWLRALQAIGTDANKPFLELTPYLIAIFQERHHYDENNTRIKHYYASESVGLATGFLISAIHNIGLVCLTHTPSPMKFLNGLLSRPKQEKLFLRLVVGYPAESAMVPELPKKNLEQVVSII
jgi:iodotyrosine deiodinase